MLINLLYIAVAVLLRFVPISLYTALLVRKGIPQRIAIENAQTLIFENPVWSIALGILNGFLGLLIVWFLVRVIEKGSFTWETVGLDWKSNSLLAVLLGTILALLLFIANIFVENLLGSSGLSRNMLLVGVSVPVLIQNFVLYLAMAFGEEVVFRGYIQTRLMERYAVVWGILLTSVLFTLLHQISYRLSPVTLLSGIILWVIVGALYQISKSLYLVVVFHGVVNTVLNTLHLTGSDLGSLFVHAIALLVMIGLIWKFRGFGTHSSAA